MSVGRAEEALPRVVAVTGPTAAGKASLGIDLAERLHVPVLVCDSVKVYRGLDIGSAKPGPDARRRVPHHLIDLVEPDAAFSAGDYASLAWEQLGQTRGVFVGGTGFYLRATAWTRSEGDASEPASPRRAAFEATWAAREEGDPGAAHRALSALDPTTAHRIHPHNLVRVVRALWLCHAQGRPISEVRREHPPRSRLHLMLLVVDPGARTLDETIASRIDAMLDRGWLAEVERLAASGYDARYKSMRSLGYKQLLDVVEGRSDLPSAREAIVAATRHYARRQRTYIRHQFPGALRVDLSDATQCPWDDVLAFARGKGSS